MLKKNKKFWLQTKAMIHRQQMLPFFIFVCLFVLIFLFFLSLGKPFVAKKAPEIPLHEQVILEPELEEALKNATDAEMCDIAGRTHCYH